MDSGYEANNWIKRIAKECRDFAIKNSIDVEILMARVLELTEKKSRNAELEKKKQILIMGSNPCNILDLQQHKVNVSSSILPQENNEKSQRPEESICFHKLDDIIRKINMYQTPDFAEDIAIRLRWKPTEDLSGIDMLKKCIELIAYSQRVKALYVKKLINTGIFDNIFANYDLDVVAKMDYEHLYSKYWSEISVITFPNKLKDMIGCAQALLNIKKQHNSFMSYLQTMNVPTELRSQSDVELFWEELSSVQKYFSLNNMPVFCKLTSLCHLFMTLGYACIKPDSAVMKAATNLGLVTPGGSVDKPTYTDAKRKYVVESIQRYCLSRNLNIRVLDGYLLIYGGQTGAKALVKPEYYQLI